MTEEMDVLNELLGGRHLVDLFVRELLAEVCHDVAQLCGTDEAVAIAVKHLEGLDQLFLRVSILHLP